MSSHDLTEDSHVRWSALRLFLLSALIFPSIAEESNAPTSEIDDVLCGPKALAVFARVHGLHNNVEEIAKLAGTSEAGTSLLGLKQAARQLGFEAEGAFANSIAQIRPMGLYAIATLRLGENHNHFVLVGRFNDDTVQVIDVPNKPYYLSVSEFDKRFAGQLLLLGTKPIAIKRIQGNYALPAILVVALIALGAVAMVIRRKGSLR